jgi:hypothetical protein
MLKMLKIKKIIWWEFTKIAHNQSASGKATDSTLMQPEQTQDQPRSVQSDYVLHCFLFSQYRFRNNNKILPINDEWFCPDWMMD